MSSDRFKKIILIALIIVLAYIWVKNIYILKDSGSLPFQISNMDRTPRRGLTDSESLNYKSPKVNPFRKPDIQSTAFSSKPKKAKKAKPVAPEKPSGRYILIGFVDRPPHSQIILRDKKNGMTLIKGLHDSLINWELTHIMTDKAIVKSGKYRDTLFLEQ